MKLSKLRNLKIASLFAGAGGLDLGFARAGHKIVWANDIDGDSVETYKKNLGNHIVLGNVADIDPNALPRFDVLIGGFPCQGFSRANVHRVENDKRNDLYVQVVKFLRFHQPRFFLLENVRGIISLNKGKDFSEIILALEESGYVVQHKIVNAADYGIPQNRIRVIISGVRSDISSEYQYIFPDPTHSKNGDESKKWLSIGEALAGIPEPDTDHSLMNHICSGYKITNRNFTGHRMTDPDKPSPTILARGNGGGGVCAIQHPKNHRRLSVRESALVQTFPINYEFTGSLSSMYRQIGNAVPVRLGEAVAGGFYKVKK